MTHALPQLPYQGGALEPTPQSRGLPDAGTLVAFDRFHAGLAIPRAEAAAPQAGALGRDVMTTSSSMSEQLRCQSVVPVESTIPTEMTIEQWRRRRGTRAVPTHRPPAHRLLALAPNPKEHTMKKLIVAAAGIAALTPAGLAAARPDATARAAATVDPVSGKEFSLRLVKKSIPRPGKVTFTFRNVGTVAHDFAIGGKQTKLIGPGKTARLTVTFHKAGRFSYRCTVPGHAQAGMRGVFTVR